VFRWREHGGPPVTAPKQTSFGTQMLKRAISDAETRLDYAADGLSFSLVAPLAAVVGEAS
jgi:two-component sensor histidine kinase